MKTICQIIFCLSIMASLVIGSCDATKYIKIDDGQVTVDVGDAAYDYLDTLICGYILKCDELGIDLDDLDITIDTTLIPGRQVRVIPLDFIYFNRSVRDPGIRNNAIKSVNALNHEYAEHEVHFMIRNETYIEKTDRTLSGWYTSTFSESEDLDILQNPDAITVVVADHGEPIGEDQLYIMGYAYPVTKDNLLSLQKNKWNNRVIMTYYALEQLKTLTHEIEHTLGNPDLREVNEYKNETKQNYMWYHHVEGDSYLNQEQIDRSLYILGYRGNLNYNMINLKLE